MASWTSEIVKFTPYIPESPLDPMLSVGLTKQQQFMEGVQKVQSYVDTLNGMDISKKEIKDYVQVKLNSFHQNINNVSGDFSDQRLISQIGGAVGKIASDPIVQNGILATNSIRNGYAQIEQARKEGKSNPNNEIYFSDAVDRWMNDGRADTQLSASYTPYFDIVKRVREIYKDMSAGQDLPPSFSLSNLSVDENGRPIFNLNSASEMVLMEGISAKRVQDAIDLVMQDGAAKQQLLIDGYARFRGLSPNDIFDNIVTSTQTQLQQINDLIAAGQAKLGGSTAGDKAQLAENIKLLEAQAKGIAANSQKLVDGLGVNPEAVKAQIVQQELTSNLIGAFSHQKMVESPLWNQNIELERLNLSKQEFIYRQLNDEANRQLDLQKALISADKAKKEKEGENYIANLPIPESAGTLGQKSMYELRENSRLKAKDLSFQALNEYAKASKQIPPFRENATTGAFEPNVGPGLYNSADEVWKKAEDLFTTFKSMRTKGTLDPTLSTYMQKEEAAWDDYKTIDNKIRNIETAVSPQIAELRRSVGTRPDGSAYPTDWFDVYAVRKKLPGWEAANQRLEAKYTKDWDLLGFNKFSPFYGNNKDYFDLESKLNKDPNLALKAQQVEDQFKKAQVSFQDKAVVLDRSKPELHNQVIQAFTAALTDQAAASPKGDAADILKMTKATEDEQKDNQYLAWSEYKNGQQTWWLGVSRGGKLSKVEVRKDVFQQNSALARAIPNVEFQNMFGMRLGLNGGKNTFREPGEIKINNGQVSAFSIPMRGGNYNVQYHLEEPEGYPGQYRLLLYVTDKTTGKAIVSGVQYPPADMVAPGSVPTFTQEQVLDQVKNRLNNPDVIKGFIDKYYPQ